MSSAVAFRAYQPLTTVAIVNDFPFAPLACFDGEAIHHTRAGETADHKEAAKAFVEKRKAAFQGN